MRNSRVVELARLAQDFAQDLEADGARGLHLAASFAGRTGLAQHVRERLARALARHLDQPELREATDRHPRAVARQRLLEFREHRVAVLDVHHVDEVDDDDAAEVAQAQLPRDRLRGFEIGLENGVVEAARADVAAGIDVDRRHRLGLIDDQIPAGFKLDAPAERTLDLRVDRVQVEQRPLAGVVGELAGDRVERTATRTAAA